MGRHYNEKSPTEALRDPTNTTYSQMRGTPDDPGSASNPWDVMLKNDDQWRRWPCRPFVFNWAMLVAVLIFAGLVIGAALLLR